MIKIFSSGELGTLEIIEIKTRHPKAGVQAALVIVTHIHEKPTFGCGACECPIQN